MGNHVLDSSFFSVFWFLLTGRRNVRKEEEKRRDEMRKRGAGEVAHLG